MLLILVLFVQGIVFITLIPILIAMVSETKNKNPNYNILQPVIDERARQNEERKKNFPWLYEQEDFYRNENDPVEEQSDIPEPEKEYPDLKAWLLDNHEIIRQITSESGEFKIPVKDLKNFRSQFEKYCFKLENVSEIKEEEGNIIIITF